MQNSWSELRLRTTGGVTVTLAMLAVGGALLSSQREAAARDSELTWGRALYAGGTALSGRMLGHDADLPAQASRCSNCHPNERHATKSDERASPLETFAPLLTRFALTEKRPRRGGPASTYDEAAFCRVLTRGIDPAFVMIAQTMPRYQLHGEQCHALWAYVTSL